MEGKRGGRGRRRREGWGKEGVREKERGMEGRGSERKRKRDGGKEVGRERGMEGRGRRKEREGWKEEARMK